MKYPQKLAWKKIGLLATAGALGGALIRAVPHKLLLLLAAGTVAGTAFLLAAVYAALQIESISPADRLAYQQFLAASQAELDQLLVAQPGKAQ